MCSLIPSPPVSLSLSLSFSLSLPSSPPHEYLYAYVWACRGQSGMLGIIMYLPPPYCFET